jgi:hypothetical protein
VGAGLRDAAMRIERLPDFLQASEAAVNELILLAIAIYFFASLEVRVKRRRALASLHRLRSIVHIIDMHQLAKDPEVADGAGEASPVTARHGLNRSALARYLDSCAELLAITSKLAALHVQRFNDTVVLSAVNDIETLVAGLSHKIWQKITILDLGAIPRAHG